MSDVLPETKNLARYACPACEPEADPLAEILILDCCAYHKPSLAGVDDARVGEGPHLGNSETDPATQAGMAALLRSAIGLAALLFLAGCAAPAPFYYCWQVVLTRPDGRQTDALECIPRRQKVPWDEQRRPGTDLFG